jgi:hypothetical protein
MSVGTTPALSGSIRLPNGGVINTRRADNAADVITIGLDASNNIGIGDSNVSAVLLNTNSNSTLRLGPNGLELIINGLTAAFGSGAGVISLARATIAPTGNPTNNGFLIYVDPADSKLKCRGSAGTITILANP